MGAVWKDVIGYGKETTYGQAATTIDRWVRFRGGFKIIPKREKIDLSGTEEHRSQIEMVGGNIAVEGEISDIEMLPDHFQGILEGALGSKSGSTFKVVDGNLPSYTFVISYGGLLYKIVGCKIRSLSIEAEAGSILKASVGIVGKKPVDISNLPSRSYSDKLPFVCYKATLTWGGSSVRCQRASVSIENSLRYPFWELGDLYSANPSEGLASVTGSFRALWDSKEEFEDFLNCQRRALVITAQTAAGDQIEMKMSNVELTDFDFDRGDQDYDQTLNFKALYDESDASPIVVTVTTV